MSITSLTSRVAIRLAVWVFVGVVVIEVLILIPSLMQRRHELIDSLAQRNRYAVATVLRTAADPGAARDTLAAAGDIEGLAIYGGDGQRLAVFGTLDAAHSRTAPRAQQPELVDGRVHVTWSLPQVGDGYRVAAVLSAARVDPALWAYALRIIGLVVLVAAFLTGLTLIVTGREVLRPLAALTTAVRAARDGGAAAHAAPDEPGEFGELAREFNAMRARQEADAARLQERRDQLQQQALHDALTRLPNRVFFLERLEQATRESARYGDRFAVVMIDLDGFKQFNDTFGHLEGDEYLRQVAARLAGGIRESDTLARLGGDEFAVLQARLRPEDDVCQLADRLLALLEEPIEVNGRHANVAASLGVTVMPDDADEAENLLVNSDLAMYRAKHGGGQCVQRFSSEFREALSRRALLEDDLRQALERDEFELHYQPIVDLRAGRVPTVEALLRWRHPAEGLLTPGRFLALAEESSLILDIGQWAIERACQDAKRLAGVYGSDVAVAVNLSARQVTESRIDAVVAAVLERTGLEPRHLVLELTESLLMPLDDSNIQCLHALREQGVGIALDDFGTGYSSLAYLRELPITTLKIDRRFIAGIDENEQDRYLIDAIVKMAGSLHLDVVAEGVETASQAAWLSTSGCRCVQGFHYSHARPLAELLDHPSAL